MAPSLPVMKKALNNQPLLKAFALLATALLTVGQIAPTRTAIDQNRLQGYWEGEGAGGKCSITITGDTLLYRAGTNWHKTTFTLPAGTEPQQLHATIKDSWPPSKDSIGTVVPAIIKIEDGTLTLAAYSIGEEPPKSFADATTKYVVKQAQTTKEKSKTPKTTEAPKPGLTCDFLKLPDIFGAAR